MPHLTRVGVATLAGVLLSCQDPSGGTWQPTPVRIDLVERLPVAQIDSPLDALHFDDRTELRYLTAGWHDLQRTRKGEAFAWTRGRNAVLEIPILRPSPRAVAIDLATLPEDKKLPQQHIRLIWNGRDLGSVPLSWGRQRVDTTIPSELQRIGPNRLELLPVYWASPGDLGIGRDPRTVGVQVFKVELPSQLPGPRSPSPAARIDGEAIVQGVNSMFTFYLPLPQEGRLKAEIRGRNTSAIGKGKLHISLLDEKDEARDLWHRNAAPLGNQHGLELDVDLSNHAGRKVALSFVFSGTTPGEVEWRRLRIEGGEEKFIADVPAHWRRQYNVLLVLFDTLRADHTQPYGSEHVDTREIAALAKRGVTFIESWANASWTRPSVASLLTSLHPEAHRVVHLNHSLPENVPYLPVLLKQAGYRTVAVSNNAQTSKTYGFDRGFDALYEYFKDRDEIVGTLPDPVAQADEVWRRYFAEPAASDTPFFFFLHEIDPHSPYEPPPPYDTLYDFGYRGNITGYARGFNDELRMHGVVNQNPAWLGKADLRQLRAQYAGEVTFMDRYLGALLAKLRQAGLERETLVIFLSDHGEQFLEHGRWGHGQTVYEEELRIPLILSLPGVLPENRRPRIHAQLSDVAPTILDLLGLPATDFQGRSLLPALQAPDTHEPERATFARSARENRRLLRDSDAVGLGDWKLIRHSRNLRKAPEFEYELYDLKADPAEELDRWPQQLVVGHTLRQMLEWQLRQDRNLDFQNRTPESVDPEVSEQLRGLGYVE